MRSASFLAVTGPRPRLGACGGASSVGPSSSSASPGCVAPRRALGPNGARRWRSGHARRQRVPRPDEAVRADDHGGRPQGAGARSGRAPADGSTSARNPSQSDEDVHQGARRALRRLPRHRATSPRRLPRKTIALGMWNHFVRPLAAKDGSPVYCDSCSPGASMTPLLDCVTMPVGARRHWMDQNFVSTVTRRDGKEHDYSTCHGESFQAALPESVGTGGGNGARLRK